MKLTAEERNQVMEQIRAIEQFTCDYYWAELKRWEESPELKLSTPTYGAVLADTIRKRSEYVRSLENWLALK